MKKKVRGKGGRNTRSKAKNSSSKSNKSKARKKKPHQTKSATKVIHKKVTPEDKIKLLEYIVDARRQGLNEREIKTNLVNAGWPKEVINKFKKPRKTSPSPKKKKITKKKKVIKKSKSKSKNKIIKDFFKTKPKKEKKIHKKSNLLKIFERKTHKKKKIKPAKPTKKVKKKLPKSKILKFFERKKGQKKTAKKVRPKKVEVKKKKKPSKPIKLDKKKLIKQLINSVISLAWTFAIILTLVNYDLLRLWINPYFEVAGTSPIYYVYIGIFALIILSLLVVSIMYLMGFPKPKRQQPIQLQKKNVKPKSEEKSNKKFGRYTTKIDTFYEAIKKEGGISLSDAEKRFKVEKDLLEEWANILENHKMIAINYKAFSSPVLTIYVDKEEENDEDIKVKKDDKKSETTKKK